MSLHSSLSQSIRQSPPIDLSKPYSADWVRDKTILITGGASGFGAGFVKHWAKHGANVIFGDRNAHGGSILEQEVKKETGNPNVKFEYCDVTNWDDQVKLFKMAVEWSPHGGIDCVVANAGIAGNDCLQQPANLDQANPPKPDFKILDVNLTGVMYTAHLAFFYLPRNTGSKDCAVDSDPATPRDRHLLFVGSLASLTPIPIQPQYGAAKHAVMGLFRSLRSSSFVQGVRVNIICPYFIDTPIVETPARIALAGGALGKTEDVIDAATRLVADRRILGRGLMIGPKVSVVQKDDGTWDLAPIDGSQPQERAIWEVYADDWAETDAFTHNVVRLLNMVQASRGWSGWAVDMVKAIGYGLGLMRR